MLNPSGSPPDVGSPGSTTGGTVLQTACQVADVSLYFLQDELVKYLFEVRTGGAAVFAASTGNTVTEAKAAGEQAMLATRDFGMALLEEHGFNIGLKLSERLVMTRSRIWDERECVKFICKDVWIVLFQKQADRLQTNRRGGYVVLDNNLPPLRHFIHSPSSSGESEIPVHHLPITLLSHFCGIVRGALTNLGFPCHVIAECPNPPTCSFQIRLK